MATARTFVYAAIGVFTMIGSHLTAQEQRFGGGTGDPNDPYLIYTADQMNEIGLDEESWAGHFRLMADIDLGAYDRDAFNLVGRLDGRPFSGVFDGNGHTISGFAYVSSDRKHVGLFEIVAGHGATVRNLGLISPRIDAPAGAGVGALVSHLHNGTVTGCFVREGSVRGGKAVGGLVGASLFGRILNCYARVSVAGDSFVGGLTGDNYGGAVIACYSTGEIAGEESTGGLLGANSGKVFQSFWDVEMSGQATSAAGTGKTTSEMHRASTFLGWTCGDEEIWTIQEGEDYPRLRWEDRSQLTIEPRRLAGVLAGSGTREDPFLVYTAYDLSLIGLFSCDWDKSFRLMEDVDLSVERRIPFHTIGYRWSESDARPFAGSFDGRGHTISGYRLDRQFPDPPVTGASTGLFGYVDDPNAEIVDVTVAQARLHDDSDGVVGTLVGYLSRGTIRTCCVFDTRIWGRRSAGGLIGENREGRIEECWADVTVDAQVAVGGLVGRNAGTISNCRSDGIVMGSEGVGGLAAYNTGMIVASRSTAVVLGGGIVGGLVAQNTGAIAKSCSAAVVSGDKTVGGLAGYNLGGIEESYADGVVAGKTDVGGLVGHNLRRGPVIGAIADCFSANIVAGDRSAGGLVGSNSGTITGSLWDVEASGQASSAGGDGKMTAEMQTTNTFLEAGWDFDMTWMICEGEDYPRLRWENMQCEE